MRYFKDKITEYCFIKCLCIYVSYDLLFIENLNI